MEMATTGRGNRRAALVCVGLLLLAAVLAVVQPSLASETWRLVLANIFQCLVLFAAALPCARLAYGWLRKAGYTKKQIGWIGVWTAVLCAAVLLFFYLYFKDEQDIKVYDYSLYWITMMDDRRTIAYSIQDYLVRLRISLSTEYSALPAFALMPASYLFGVSYTGYCQNVFTLYYLPAAFLLTVLAVRISASLRNTRPDVPTFVACQVLCTLFPVLLYPVLHGYLDVVGVLVIALMLNFSYDWNGIPFSIKRNLTLAGLSLLLLLLRRWYAYYIVGFYFAVGVIAAMHTIRMREPLVKNFLKVMGNLGMIAVVAVVAIVLLNRDIFSLFLSNNYGEAYSAYKTLSTARDLEYMMRYVGGLGALFACVGVGLSFYHAQTRAMGMRLVIALVVATAMFLRVQSFGHHHMYLVMPTIAVFIMVFVGFVLQYITLKKRRVVSGGLIAFCCLNIGFAYAPGMGELAGFMGIASTSLRSYPVQMPHFDTYWQIVYELDQRTDGKAASVYMLGDTPVGPEYLRRINLPWQKDAAPFAMINNIVDLRDGFPSQMFFADYVMVTDPVVTALSEVQQITYQVYDMFQDDPMMEAYYEVDTSYTLGNFELTLYKKIRSADRALVDALRDRLRVLYPGDPFVYEPNYFVALAEFEKSMTSYDYYGNELTFTASPGEPARFRLNDTAAFSTLSFLLRNADPGFSVQIENQTGEIYRSDAVWQDTDFSVDIAGSEYLQVTLAVDDAVEDGLYWCMLDFRPDSLR